MMMNEDDDEEDNFTQFALCNMFSRAVVLEHDLERGRSSISRILKQHGSPNIKNKKL